MSKSDKAGKTGSSHTVIEGLVEFTDVDLGVKWIGLNPQGDLAIGARGVAGANL